MNSFRRKNVLSAELSAEKASRNRQPIRYDRLLIFALLLFAAVLILSQALLEPRHDPVIGEIAERDIFAPRDFIFYDTPAAEARWREEFERLPAPYLFDTGGFDLAAAALRQAIAEANFSHPDQIIHRVNDLIDKSKRVGLLERSYEEERLLLIRKGEGETRIIASSEVIQPGHWDPHLRGLAEDEALQLAGFFEKHLKPTLVFDHESAKQTLAEIQKRHPVAPAIFSPEIPLVVVGQELDERHVEILRQRDAFAARRNFAMVIGLSGLIALTLIFGALYMKQYLAAMYERVRDVSAICFAFGSVLLLCLLVKMAISLDFGIIRFSNAALPVATIAMLLTILYGARMAFMFSMLASVLIAVVTAPRIELLVMFIFGSMTGAITAATARRRSDLIRSSLFVAVVQLLVIILVGMMHATPFLSVRIDVFSAIFSGLASAAFVQLLLLPFESISHRTSNFTLIELGDLNHPLLQLLLRKAPGTFQHSQHVAILAQAASEAIGANSLLARTGAYFHDIGKMRKPEYFTENQGPGENPHDRLKPSLSASVLKAHVLDGIIMAQEERLPEGVIDFIAQHHGTAVISFFYHRALEIAGDEMEVNRADFQYSGPNPQTPEIGIVMLADRVEATARGMNNPTAPKLEKMVRRSIGEVFESGQLDDCELTLKELTIIGECFTRVLSGIFHSRKIEYPDADEISEAEKKARGE